MTKKETDYISRINTLSSEQILLDVEKVQDSDTELPCKIVLFQGIPKKIRWNLSYRKLWN